MKENKRNVYPDVIMDELPMGLEVSPAMKRLYDQWPHSDDRKNEFFTNFKYSEITGIGSDEEVSRRDPSKVIKVGDTYYVYYTRRKTRVEPVGIHVFNESYEIPTFDWDLSDIYCASSKDGFNWVEEGPSVERAPKGEYGDRSLSTPDVLVWKGKYYLYYQTFTGPFREETNDYCDVSMAWADSPLGPWHKTTDPVIKQGELEDWDSMAIHDPYPLVYKGKIWVYYKGENLRVGGDPVNMVRAQGVAIADTPEGPYVKHPMNPVTNSGHETFLFPYNEGIAAVLTFDGIEKNTIQYAEDGVNFEMKSHVHCPPIAAGPYSPDAFTDSGDANGVTWGLFHVECGDVKARCRCHIARFDCDLDRRFNRKLYRDPYDFYGRYSEETYFGKDMELSNDLREEMILRELMMK